MIKGEEKVRLPRAVRPETCGWSSPPVYQFVSFVSFQKSGGGSSLSHQSLSTRDGLGIMILSGDLILSQRASYAIGIDSLGCGFWFPGLVALY